jgi:hypothetical protein
LHPTAADDVWESVSFEKHVSKLHRAKGLADEWKRGFFAGATMESAEISRRHIAGLGITGTIS